jgi:hypothetical protein
MIELKEKIIINPPPFSDNTGKTIKQPPLIFTSINPTILDNPLNSTVGVSINGIPKIINVIPKEEYSLNSDWTREEIENKLLTILGDDPASKLRSFFPKTLEECPNCPGTILSKMIKKMGIVITSNCSCRRHALAMNENGNDWCENNIETIVGWLKEEAQKRKLPFIDAAGRFMIKRAIQKSRKLLSKKQD